MVKLRRQRLPRPISIFYYFGLCLFSFKKNTVENVYKQIKIQRRKVSDKAEDSSKKLSTPDTSKNHKILAEKDSGIDFPKLPARN